MKKFEAYYDVDYRQNEILVPITLSSNEGSGIPGQMGRLARSFAACIHKVWMQMKLRPKFRSLAQHGQLQ